MAAGPSSSKSGGEGANFSSLRMLAKAKTAVDELHYKGWSVKLGDWVHISNPDDPARPIPGQVFKCWTSTDPSVLPSLQSLISHGIVLLEPDSASQA